MEAIVATSDSDESPSSESFSRDNEEWGYEGAPLLPQASQASHITPAPWLSRHLR